MQYPLQIIDGILNRFTMYKVLLWGLIGLFVVADVLAFTGAVSVGPFGLLLSVVVLCAVCYMTNEVFARIWRATVNAESWIITALILVFLLPPIDSLHRALLVALCGAIAMASKFVLVFRGTHVFNPAALAAAVMSITGLLPATWWVATPYLAPFAAILALIILRKQRQFAIFFAFAAAALAVLVYVNTGLQGAGLGLTLKSAVLSWPVIFMGSVMLIEPSTFPPRRYYQLLFAVLVGVLFSSQLHWGQLSATPQNALLAGNILTLLFAPAIGAMLRLKQITSIGKNQYDLAFERSPHLTFMPGQYLEWTLKHKGADVRGNRRMFSIASSPTQPEVHIGIKTYEPSSSFKKALLAMRPGQRIRVAHVAGNFTLPQETDRKLVFIAGGIGITPFHSMVQYLTDKNETRDITLFYLANTAEDFVYQDDLTAAESVGVKTNYVIGKLEEQNLRDHLDLFKQSLVYISGPNGLVSHYKHVLITLGVPRANIKTDHFTGY